jgi:hypothetical protein
MLPLAVIEDLDVFDTGGLHIRMPLVAYAMHTLVLEAVESALGRRVDAQQFPLWLIEHVLPYSWSLAARHGWHTARIQPVGMVNEPRRRAIAEPRHCHGVCHDVGSHSWGMPRTRAASPMNAHGASRPA